MMRLHFEPTGAVAGASIKTYLLEKSRAVAITDPERNYHVFYLLLAGAAKEHLGPTAGVHSHTLASRNARRRPSCAVGPP